MTVPQGKELQQPVVLSDVLDFVLKGEPFLHKELLDRNVNEFEHADDDGQHHEDLSSAYYIPFTIIIRYIHLTFIHLVGSESCFAPFCVEATLSFLNESISGLHITTKISFRVPIRGKITEHFDVIYSPTISWVRK